MRPSRGAAPHGAAGKLRHGASGGGGSILSAPPAPPARPQRRQRHFLRRGPSSEGSRFPAAAAARTRRWLPGSGRRRTWAPAPSRSCRCSWHCSAARVSGDGGGTREPALRGRDPRDGTAGRRPRDENSPRPRCDPPVPPHRWPKGSRLCPHRQGLSPPGEEVWGAASIREGTNPPRFPEYAEHSPAAPWDPRNPGCVTGAAAGGVEDSMAESWSRRDLGGLGWLWWPPVTTDYGGVDQELRTRNGEKTLKLHMGCGAGAGGKKWEQKKPT